MKTYELTYIISARLTQDEVVNVVKDIETFIQSNEGVIVTSEKTQAEVLAYPIKKQGSGYFVMCQFQFPEKGVMALKATLEAQKDILRHMILVKRPLKPSKEKRTRKPLAAADSQMPKAFPSEGSGKAEKLDAADLNKKLDEILT